jgi:hypothetical protein
MSRFVTFGYGGGGKLYEGSSLGDAVAAASAWATEQDAGAAVRDGETGAQVYAQIGEDVIQEVGK